MSSGYNDDGDESYLLICNVIGLVALILGLTFQIPFLIGCGVGVFIGMLLIRLTIY